MSTLPPYVETPGDAEAPPPYEFLGAQAIGFSLLADPKRLQEICDAQLNIAPESETGFTFRPVGWPVSSCVLLEVLTYSESRCLSERWRRLGTVSCSDAYAALPLLKWVLGAPHEFALFTPCIWVDNPLPMVTGREVMGYPKMLGRFTWPNGLGTYPTSMATVLHATKGSQASWLPLFDVRGRGSDTPAAVGDVSWPLGPMGLQHGDHGALRLRPEQLSILERMGLDQSYSGVQLKQFRDAAYQRRADWQSITGSTIALSNVRDQGQLPPATITFQTYFNSDLPKFLGLLGGPSDFHSVTALQLTADFVMAEAVNLQVTRRLPPARREAGVRVVGGYPFRTPRS